MVRCGEIRKCEPCSRTDPRFSCLGRLSCGPPVTIFMGICIRVISPTPSKKFRRAAASVLNARLPIHTEFWRLGTFEGGRSAEFFTFFLSEPSAEASPALLVRSSFFFFCLRFSACESTGVSLVSPASDSSPEPSEFESLSESSLSASSDTRARFWGGGDEDEARSDSEELPEVEEDMEAEIMCVRSRSGAPTLG